MKYKFKYRNDIQGLRGIAVLSVALFHLDFSTISRGYLGVDVFFVISGYLMALIISQDDFNLRTFYLKRIMRLLPAFYTVIALTFVFSYLIMDKIQFYDFAQSLVAVSLYSSNFLFWLEANYFSEVAALKPLLHTWSLAIEEQFYFFFPLLFLFILERRKLIFLLCFLALCSMFLYLYLATEFPELVFYITIFRSWELLVGAGIALFKFTLTPRFTYYLKPIVTSLLIVILFTSITTGISDDILLCVTVFLTSLLLMCNGDDFLSNYILKNKILIGLGFISYSVYLVHQPVISLYKLTQIHDLIILEKILLFIVIVLISCFLFIGVEQKLKYSEDINSRRVVSLSLGSSIFFVSLGFLSLIFIERLPAVGVLNKLNYFEYADENRALRIESWQPLKTLSGSENYTLENNEFDNSKWFDDGKKQILIIGNSHSKDMFNVFTSSKKYSEDYHFTRYGIQIKDLNSNHEFYTTPNFALADVIVIASKLDEGDVGNVSDVLKKMKLLGKQVVVLGNVFAFKEFRLGKWTLADAIAADWDQSVRGLVDSIQREYYNDYSMRRGSFDDDQLRLRKIVEDEGAIFLDRMEYICDQLVGKCYGVDASGEKAFYDYGHHTLSGAAYFAERIHEIGWFESVIELGKK